MKYIRNLKYSAILIIVIVWCVPALASVVHLNCTCCTQKKPCCEPTSQNSLQIEKNDKNCPQCQCRISEKSVAENTYLTTTLPVKNNVNLYSNNNVNIITPVLPETGVMLSSQTIYLKFTPLFIKNSSFLI